MVSTRFARAGHVPVTLVIKEMVSTVQVCLKVQQNSLSYEKEVKADFASLMFLDCSVVYRVLCMRMKVLEQPKFESLTFLFILIRQYSDEVHCRIRMSRQNLSFSVNLLSSPSLCLKLDCTLNLTMKTVISACIFPALGHI